MYWSIQIALGFLLSLVFLYALQLYQDFQRALKDIDGLPGYRSFFHLDSDVAGLIHAFTRLTVGRQNLWVEKYRVYEKAGWDVLSAVSIWPTIQTSLLLADASAIKEVSSSRSRFPKPVEKYGVLSIFGRNIVASEGEEWKKYRKISAPAFSDRNNKLVWDGTVKIMLNMFETVWGDKEVITVDHCVNITLPIALRVIGIAGFGHDIPWGVDSNLPPGHQMTFKEALHLVSSNIFLKLLAPAWVLGTTERLRRIRLSFNELEVYMREMISERKNPQMKEERYDLFTNLLDANDDDQISSEGNKLTESELMGNIFIFLLAGHETTAHTLCYTFALLALYQDEQEALYQHIKSVLPDGRLPSYEEMPLLTRSMAVFYETLRMFPPVVGIPKDSAEDTVLVASNANGETRSVPVPKGTTVMLHPAGLHYNPRYWKDPDLFNPSRFLEEWPRDAFVPFSSGARACLGRKFFETEGVAVLTLLVSRYKIEVKEDFQFIGETLESRRSRITKSGQGLTLTPSRVPLVFHKR